MNTTKLVLPASLLSAGEETSLARQIEAGVDAGGGKPFCPRPRRRHRQMLRGIRMGVDGYIDPSQPGRWRLWL